MESSSGRAKFKPFALLLVAQRKLFHSSMTTKSEWMQNLGLSGDSGYGGGGPKGPRPQLLGLTHESLSIKWEPASGIAIRQYVVELACVDEPGVPPEDDDWDLIYEDASPGCEISCLTGESEYCMRVAWVDLRGTQCAWGPTLKITTLPEPARKKKSPPKKKAVRLRRTNHF